MRWIPTDWNQNTAPATSYLGHWSSPSMHRGMWLRGRAALDLIGLFEAMTVLGLIQGYLVHPGQLEWEVNGKPQRCAVTFRCERSGHADCLIVASAAAMRSGWTLPDRIVLDDGDQMHVFDLIRVHPLQILPSCRAALTPARIARLPTDPALQPLAHLVERIASALFPQRCDAPDDAPGTRCRLRPHDL